MKWLSMACSTHWNDENMKGRKYLEDPSRWEDNIKMDVTEIDFWMWSGFIWSR
jgi:hypothetical protein